MANRRSEKHDYSVIDGLVKWTKSEHGFERGVDYRIFPRFDPKTKAVKVIRLMPKSKDAKEVLHRLPKLFMKYEGVSEVNQANDGAIFIRFTEKQGPKPKAVKMLTAGKKIRKKRAVYKVGHTKLSNRKSTGKRAPKYRLPKDCSKKPHIVTVINLLNSFTGTQRAECVNVVSKFLPNGEKVAIRLRKRRILSAKSRKKLFDTVIDILKEQDAK